MTPIVATGLLSLAGKAVEHFLPPRAAAAPQADPATAAKFDALMQAAARSPVSTPPRVTAASLTEQVQQWSTVQDALKTAPDAQGLEISTTGGLSVRLADGKLEPVNISPGQRMELLQLRDLSAAPAGKPLVVPA